MQVLTNHCNHKQRPFIPSNYPNSFSTCLLACCKSPVSTIRHKLTHLQAYFVEKPDTTFQDSSVYFGLFNLCDRQDTIWVYHNCVSAWFCWHFQMDLFKLEFPTGFLELFEWKNIYKLPDECNPSTKITNIKLQHCFVIMLSTFNCLWHTKNYC